MRQKQTEVAAAFNSSSIFEDPLYANKSYIMEFLSKLNYQRKKIPSGNPSGDTQTSSLSASQPNVTTLFSPPKPCVGVAEEKKTSTNSVASQESVHEFSIRMGDYLGTEPPVSLMRFTGEVNPETWTKCKMARDRKHCGTGQGMKSVIEGPLTGAGSEYGAQARLEAKEQMLARKYRKKAIKREDQSWIMKLTTETETGRRYKGTKEGGILDHASYYIFTAKQDGNGLVYEAFPVKSWFDFKPIPRRTNFTAEEAEERFKQRNDTYNYFSLLTRKRLGVLEESNGNLADKKRAKLQYDNGDISSSDDEETGKGNKLVKKKQDKNGRLNENGEDLEDGMELEFMSSSDDSSSEADDAEGEDETTEGNDHLSNSSGTDTEDEENNKPTK